MQAESLGQITTVVEGHFRLRAVKVDGSGHRELADFKNLILDSGLDKLCQASPAILGWVRVGGGTTPPAANQSALISQIASTNTYQYSLNTESTSAPYTITRRRGWRFAAGVATGNIAEIGVGWGSTGNTLFSRALVMDANGVPTVVSVQSDEFLDVEYTLTLRPNATDAITTLNINGTAHTLVSRIARAGTPEWRIPVGDDTLLQGVSSGSAVSAGGIGSITGSITGAQTAVTLAVALQPYVAGSGFTEGEYSLGLAEGNIGGFSAMFFATGGYVPYQISFDPPIPKTASQIFRFRFRIQFTRA